MKNKYKKVHPSSSDNTSNSEESSTGENPPVEKTHSSSLLSIDSRENKNAAPPRLKGEEKDDVKCTSRRFVNVFTTILLPTAMCIACLSVGVTFLAHRIKESNNSDGTLTSSTTPSPTISREGEVGADVPLNTNETSSENHMHNETAPDMTYPVPSSPPTPGFGVRGNRKRSAAPNPVTYSPSLPPIIGPELLLSQSALLWEEVGSVVIGSTLHQLYGISVAISADGTRMAVGSPSHGGSGAVYVYHQHDNSTDSTTSNSSLVWSAMGSSTLMGDIQDDQFGYSIDMSADGNMLAVGIPMHDVVHGENAIVGSGLARVFEYSEYLQEWNPYGPPIEGKYPGNRFGMVVSLAASGDRLAVGAPWDEYDGTKSGYVSVFQHDRRTTNTDDDGVTWTQLYDNIFGDLVGTDFGFALSLSQDGHILAVGAPRANGDQGAVRVYKDRYSYWERMGPDLLGESDTESLGMSLSLSHSGHRLAVGSPNSNGDYDDKDSRSRGHVRVYDFNDEAAYWKPLGSDIVGDAGGDRCGYSLSLSGDGLRLAVGALFNDKGGTDSGHVRVFALEVASSTFPPSWVQLGEDIVGQDSGDWLGYSVSLSDDGTQIVIGEPSDDGSGVARVFGLEQHDEIA